MTLLAALFAGWFAYLAAGCVLGRPVGVARLSVEGRDGPWARLAAAVAPVPPLRFVALSVVCAVFTFLLGAVATGAPLVAVVPALVVAGVPAAWQARRRTARVRAVREAWPDGLRDVAASVASGRSVTQALEALGTNGPLALRASFAGFGSMARTFGTSAALRMIADDLADATTDRVIEVLVLAQERGGRIVTEILDDLVVGTTRDLKVLDEIESEGLEMRINAAAVVVLPWLVLVLLTVRGGAFRAFYASTAGLLVILVGALLSAAGYLWIRHLGRGHDEPRVLASVGEVRP
jgi:tight adherence protein B